MILSLFIVITKSALGTGDTLVVDYSNKTNYLTPIMLEVLEHSSSKHLVIQVVNLDSDIKAEASGCMWLDTFYVQNEDIFIELKFEDSIAIKYPERLFVSFSLDETRIKLMQFYFVSKIITHKTNRETPDTTEINNPELIFFNVPITHFQNLHVEIITNDTVEIKDSGLTMYLEPVYFRCTSNQVIKIVFTSGRSQDVHYIKCDCEDRGSPTDSPF
ncbi:hypothetical protein GCM10011318_11440 [Phaeocystidibacter marisrubri]|nr:hypothetical protein GCM10011318_11440 [Phaeocystidibacter marisrubri]